MKTKPFLSLIMGGAYYLMLKNGFHQFVRFLNESDKFTLSVVPLFFRNLKRGKFGG
jgi:hypothetical protein